MACASRLFVCGLFTWLSAIGCRDRKPPTAAAAPDAARPTASPAFDAAAWLTSAIVTPPIVEDAFAPRRATFAGKAVDILLCKLDAAGPRMRHHYEHQALPSMAAAGDGSLYVVDNESKLRHYVNRARDGCELVLDVEFGTRGILDLGLPVGASLHDVSVDAHGVVRVSSNDVAISEKTIARGRVGSGCEGSVHAAPHGALMVRSIATLMVTRDGGCSGSPLRLGGFDDSPSPSDAPRVIGLVGQEIVVAGTDKAQDGPTPKIGVHRADGTQRLKLANPSGDERLAYLLDASPCGGDLCVLGGTFRGYLYRYSMDGAFRGELDVAVMKPRRLGATREGLFVAGAMSAKDGGHVGVIVLVRDAD